jgi:hypothetical protein
MITSGTWKLIRVNADRDDEHFEIMAEDKSQNAISEIARLDDIFGFPPGVAEANGKIMAAAPEMLRRLQSAKKLLLGLIDAKDRLELPELASYTLCFLLGLIQGGIDAAEAGISVYSPPALNEPADWSETIDL